MSFLQLRKFLWSEEIYQRLQFSLVKVGIKCITIIQGINTVLLPYTAVQLNTPQDFYYCCSTWFPQADNSLHMQHDQGKIVYLWCCFLCKFFSSCYGSHWQIRSGTTHMETAIWKINKSVAVYKFMDHKRKISQTFFTLLFFHYSFFILCILLTKEKGKFFSFFFQTSCFLIRLSAFGHSCVCCRTSVCPWLTSIWTSGNGIYIPNFVFILFAKIQDFSKWLCPIRNNRLDCLNKKTLEGMNESD